MVSFIIFRLLRIRRLRYLTRSRVFYVALFFASMWIINALLFYYSEHVVAGRSDIDIWASLYWSIITMATIGYGDVTPIRGLGWIVAGFAAIMGIVAYTLTVSVIADWFLSKSIRRSLGMAPLKGKRILVIGGSDSCREIIDELILNNYGDQIGWVTPVQPKGASMIDYLVGDPGNEDVLLKAGIRDARHVYLCIGDDSKTLYTALMIKHLNPQAEIYAVVSSAKTEELLREAGVNILSR
jgi:voltage-gated potassium channel